MCYSGKCPFEQYNGDCKIPFDLHISGCKDPEETDEEYKDKISKINNMLVERNNE
jgi:hypothetical protein